MKLLIIKLLLMLLLLTFSEHPLRGQEDPRSLTLEEALNLALENNFEIKKQQQAVRSADADFKLTNAIYLPEVNVSENFTTTTSPLLAFGLKLNQEATDVSDFDPKYLNDPNRIENFNTRIEVFQPIINPEGYAARKSADALKKASREKQQATWHQVRYEVKSWYYKLKLAYESFAVIEKNLETSKVNYKSANDKFKQGMIHKPDLLSAKIRVLELESELISAKNDLENVSVYFSYILNTEDENIYPVDDLKEEEYPASYLDVSTVSDNNSEIKAISWQMTASQNQLKAAKLKFLPELNVFGSYEWNDDELFGVQAENYMIGAALQWNLFAGGRKFANIQKHKANLNQAEIALKQVRRAKDVKLKEIQKKIVLTKKQMELAKESIDQAKEAYRIKRNRFKEGMEKVEDLLAAEATLMNKELEYLNNIYNYNSSVFELERIIEENLTDK